jgi:benzoate membrane transport protein
MAIFERGARPRVRWRDVAAGYDRHMLANALVAFLFSVTGPLVILLAVSTNGGLGREHIASWIFAGYAFGGVLSVIASVAYRQPIGIAWSIPGAVLIGPALQHLAFAEIVGAYLATGVLMLALGLTGVARKAMARVPMPIVMGMVSGVFLPFGIRIVTGFVDDTLIAFAVVASFFAASAVPAIGRVVPPVLAAMIIGIATMLLSGHFQFNEPLQWALAEPRLYMPVFSGHAMFELVIPLAVAVLGIQNPQGIAILKSSGYDPPVNALTIMCGVGTLFFGIFGAVPTTVTGPSNAIMCSSGSQEQRFVAGIIYGLLLLSFGLLAPLATQIGLALPTAFIGVLGGLSMLRVLQGALVSTFGGELTLGALATFLVTISGVTIFNIGAPFWGLVFGIAASWLLERDALRKVWYG